MTWKLGRRVFFLNLSFLLCHSGVSFAQNFESLGQIPLQFDSFQRSFQQSSVPARVSEFSPGENLGCVCIGQKQGQEMLSRGEVSVADPPTGTQGDSSLELTARFQAFDDFNAPSETQSIVLKNYGELMGSAGKLQVVLRKLSSSAERFYVLETSAVDYASGDTRPVAYSICRGGLSKPATALSDETQASSDRKSSWIRFNDVYTESVYLNRVNTVAPFAALRSGWRSADYKWEIYGVARGSLDTRTHASESPYGIYDDNYAFEGVGVERKNVLPGVTAQLQVGVSEDLSSKIHRGGPDFRTGFITYHEISYPSTHAHSEIYSEWLYDSRYENFIGDVNWLTINEMWSGAVGGSKTWHYTLGPEISLFGSIDTQRLDYNRMAEIRAGFRYKLMKPGFSLAVQPYYVLGTRWQRPSDLPHYRDFRVLLWLFSSF